MHDHAPGPQDSPLAPNRLSPSLAVTGFLMVGVLFLWANPAFGVQVRQWPWDQLAQGHSSLLVKLVFLLWAGTGFWCLAMAFSRAVRVRALGAAMLGIVLLVQVTGGQAGLTITQYNLNKMIPMIMVGGGLLLVREPATRGTGRLVSGFGALLLIWALATGYPNSGSASQLEVFLGELWTVLQDPGHQFEGRDNHLWWHIVPQALVLLGALGGLLALFGLTTRALATTAFWILFGGLLMQGVAASALYLAAEGGGMRDVLKQVSDTAINRGTLVWMLGVFTIADFGKIRALEAA